MNKVFNFITRIPVIGIITVVCVSVFIGLSQCKGGNSELNSTERDQIIAHVTDSLKDQYSKQNLASTNNIRKSLNDSITKRDASIKTLMSRLAIVSLSEKTSRSKFKKILSSYVADSSKVSCKEALSACVDNNADLDNKVKVQDSLLNENVEKIKSLDFKITTYKSDSIEYNNMINQDKETSAADKALIEQYKISVKKLTSPVQKSKLYVGAVIGATIAILVTK